MAQYEVQFVTVGNDKHIPALKAICPTCKSINLKTKFFTVNFPICYATCPKGHTWKIDCKLDA